MVGLRASDTKLEENLWTHQTDGFLQKVLTFLKSRSLCKVGKEELKSYQKNPENPENPEKVARDLVATKD